MSAELEGRVLTASEGCGRLFLDAVPGCDVRALYAQPYADGDGLERAWSHAMDRRVRLAKELGSELILLIVPDAHSVHAEDLPQGWTFAAPTVGDRFMERFGDRATVIHPREALREADAAAPVWRRTDSHWSAWGAYVAYRLVMAAIPPERGARIVQPNEFALRWRPDLGDLGALSRPPHTAQAPGVTLNAPRARVVDDRSNAKRDAYKVFEVDEPALPTCVVFRDSFATDMAPYLVESFRRTVLVAAGARGFPELIAHERPDVILVERCERTLPFGAIDWGPLTWREHWPDPSCGLDEPAALAAERRAWRALDAGLADAALEAATEAVGRGPTPDRRFMLGRAHLLVGDAAAAAAALAAAVAEDATRFAFLLHLGVARLRQERVADARDLFTRACAADPLHPLGHEHLGYAELALGDPAAAIAALERAVALGPEVAGGWVWLAAAHEAAGAFGRAREVRAQAHAACPGDPALPPPPHPEPVEGHRRRAGRAPVPIVLSLSKDAAAPGG